MSAVWTRSTRAPQENGPPDHKSVGGRHMHALLSGGFVTGELAGLQETSRSRNAYTAGIGQANTKKNGRHKGLSSRPLVACSRAAGSL